MSNNNSISKININNDLIFNKSIISRLMKNMILQYKIGKSASIVLTSVLEYFTFDILETIILYIEQKTKKTRITSEIIFEVLQSDNILFKLFKNKSIFIQHKKGVELLDIKRTQINLDRDNEN